MMKKQKNNWESVFILSGEYTQIKQAKEAILGEKQISSSRFFFKNDDAKVLEGELFNKGYFHQPTAYIIYDPLTEMVKICQKYIENENMRGDLIIVINNGDSLDNRMSFYNAARKNNRVLLFDYDLANDMRPLVGHMAKWAENNEITLSRVVVDYFKQNAPTINMKVQSGTSKKDAEVFDYTSIDNELGKIKILQKTKEITKEDLEEICLFSQEIDIWKFTECLLSFDGSHIYKTASKAIKGQNLETLLWGVIASLKFLIEVKSMMEQGYYSSDVIADKISLNGLSGKYLDENWQEIETAVPSVNSWRVKINMESARKVEMHQIVDQYKSALNTLFNLRDGISPEIALPLLVLGLCGEVKPSLIALTV